MTTKFVPAYVPVAVNAFQLKTGLQALNAGDWLLITEDNKVYGLTDEKFKRQYRPAPEQEQAPQSVAQPQRRRASGSEATPARKTPATWDEIKERKKIKAQTLSPDKLIRPFSQEAHVLRAVVDHFSRHNNGASNAALSRLVPSNINVSARACGLADKLLIAVSTDEEGVRRYMPTDLGLRLDHLLAAVGQPAPQNNAAAADA